MDIQNIKKEIIKAGESAVLQLIKVAKEDIIKYDKKLCIMDAFEIIKKIQEEKDLIEGVDTKINNTPKGFAESRSK